MTHELTENETKAALVLVGCCLENMGGDRPSDLEYDPYTWVYPEDLINAGWSRHEAAGTWNALIQKAVVQKYDSDFVLADPAWRYLDTVWDEKGGAA